MGDLGPIRAHNGTGAVWQKLSKLVIPLILTDLLNAFVQFIFGTGRGSGRNTLQAQLVNAPRVKKTRVELLCCSERRGLHVAIHLYVVTKYRGLIPDRLSKARREALIQSVSDVSVARPMSHPGASCDLGLSLAFAILSLAQNPYCPTMSKKSREMIYINTTNQSVYSI